MLVSLINFMACASFFICFSSCFPMSFFCSFSPLRTFVHHHLLHAFMTFCTWWLRQRICLHCGRPEFNSQFGKTPWRRKWLPTPVFLPGEFRGQRSLADYSPWGLKESDMTERRSIAQHKYYLLWSLRIPILRMREGSEIEYTIWGHSKYHSRQGHFFI